MKTRKAFRIAAQILLIGLLVGADQLLKHWAERVLGGGRVLQADGFMALRYVRNTGAAFSLFSDHTVLLSVVTAVSSVPSAADGPIHSPPQARQTASIVKFFISDTSSC